MMSGRRTLKMLTMLVVMVGQCQSSPLHQSELILAEPSVHCSLEYSTTWVTDYKEVETEECETEYSSLCVTETNVVCVDSVVTQCDTVFNNKCHTEYNTVCTEAFRPELEPFIETECEVKYSEECDYRWEGEGNDKVWVPIPGTCKQEPYEECVDVAKTKERQIPYPVCQDVPNQVNDSNSIKYQIIIQNIRSVLMSLLKFVTTFLNRNVLKSLLKSARDGVDTLYKTQRKCFLRYIKPKVLILN